MRDTVAVLGRGSPPYGTYIIGMGLARKTTTCITNNVKRSSTFRHQFHSDLLSTADMSVR